MVSWIYLMPYGPHPELPVSTQREHQSLAEGEAGWPGFEPVRHRGQGACQRHHRGPDFWQMREISGQGLVGLTMACSPTSAWATPRMSRRLRIEWPSGIVQELQNVAADQFLTVVESQGYTNDAVRNSRRGQNRWRHRTLLHRTGRRCALHPGSVHEPGHLDQADGSNQRRRHGQFTDTRATNYTKRFYRLQVP